MSLKTVGEGALGLVIAAIGIVFYFAVWGAGIILALMAGSCLLKGVGIL